eukprot:jgi/Chlat1/6147/Chrsp41S09031
MAWLRHELRVGLMTMLVFMPAAIMVWRTGRLARDETVMREAGSGVKLNNTAYLPSGTPIAAFACPADDGNDNELWQWQTAESLSSSCMIHEQGMRAVLTECDTSAASQTWTVHSQQLQTTIAPTQLPAVRLGRQGGAGRANCCPTVTVVSMHATSQQPKNEHSSNEVFYRHSSHKMSRSKFGTMRS